MKKISLILAVIISLSTIFTCITPVSAVTNEVAVVLDGEKLEFFSLILNFER